jgi:NTE family protein
VTVFPVPSPLLLPGGGFRAMLFHAGALMRVNELGLLSTTKRISSVSGESIAAGYLGCIWSQLGPPDATGSYSLFKEKYVEPISRSPGKALMLATS